MTGPGSLTALDRSYAYDVTAGTPGPVDPGPDLDRVEDHRDGAESRFYFYDELGRLGKATTLSGSPVFTYAYDAAGNRTQQSSAAGTTSYAYEPGTDRLAASTGAAPLVYAHDGFGNRTWAGPSAPAQGQATHRYNEESRLVTVQTAAQTPSVVAQYAYDGMGRRVKKVASYLTTYFFYDRDGQLLAEVTPRSGDTDIVRRYVFVEGELMGLVDRWDADAGTPAWAPLFWFEIPGELRPPPGIVPVAVLLIAAALLVPALRRRPLAAAGLALTATVSLGSLCDPPPQFLAVHTDVLGTPLAVTDSPDPEAQPPALPRVVWRASYEPYGRATVDQNPDGDGTGFALNVRLPGQYYDLETGLHYNFFRTYDPVTGRYLEADPIGQAGGLNPYVYVTADPINSVDRTGLIQFKTDPKTGQPYPDEALTDRIRNEYDLIDSVFVNAGLPEPVATSTYTDERGPHRGNRASLHDACLAIDIQGRKLTDSEQDAVAKALSEALDGDFDVRSEHFLGNPARDHIHLEFDPRDGRSGSFGIDRD